MPLDKEQFVLLIWELWPEELKIFLLPPDSPLVELAKLSDGSYINGDDLPDDHPIFELDEKLEYIAPSDSRNISNIELVALYRCGWFLC